MSSEACLSDIAEIVMGQSPKGVDVNQSNEGLPLLNGPTEFTNLYPQPVQFTEYGKRFAETGDILFCVRGSTTGRMNYADQKYAIGRGIGAIRGKNGFPTPYVRAVIEQNLDRLLQNTTGSTFPNLSRDALNSFKVQTVTAEIARQINKLIVAFEQKIYLNSQINQTLEQMAQAIFKSWFVDFEPTKAKIAVLDAGGTEEDALLAAMTAISGKNNAELEQYKNVSPEQYDKLKSTAELFPSEMQDSELGEIPDGWKIQSIGEAVTAVGGGTPSTKKSEFWDGGVINWTTPRDLSSLQDKILTDTSRKITEQGLAKISSRLLPVDTVLMSSRAPVGYLALAKIPVAINQGYIAMKCDKVLTPEYVLQWCSASMEKIKGRAGGTTFAEISRTSFREIPVIVPSQGVITNYSDTVKSIYELITKNILQTKTLAEIRDTLLPRLLSGEIDVSAITD